MVKTLKFLFSLLFVVGLFNIGEATHLVGGSMSYTYVGQKANGNREYRVSIKMYRDCAASSVIFDDVIGVAVYNNNPSRSFYSEFNFSKIEEKSVDPPNGTNCPAIDEVCLREAFYERIIELPPSAVGYHLYFYRCCRNSQMNIFDDEGQTYYAFIPPSSVINSSPRFIGVPAPFICVNDTTEYLNMTVDPDGDSLVYRLVHPWAGGDAQFPTMDIPPANLPNPIPTVQYRFGHNTNIPFGSNGFAGIDRDNGLTTYFAPREGRYAIAIEVSEFRNGILISTVRLDVQMIVIRCTPNRTPVISSVSGFNHEVTVGQQICFDIGASDFDNPGQDVTISGSGEIFTGEGGWVGPTATFSTSTGNRTVTSKFCWTPSCDQVSETPYVFAIEALDKGCPPKRKIENFRIKVNPFGGLLNPTGPLVICQSDLPVTYNAGGLNNSKFRWTSTGGTLLNADDSASTLNVIWNTPGNYTITVIESNPIGCQSAPKSLNIRVVAKPNTPNISGPDTVCEFDVNEIYQVPASPGSSYFWFANGASINGSNTGNSVNVSFPGVGNAELNVYEINAEGCIGDTSIFPVSIITATPSQIEGSPSVCPNSKLVEYRVVENFGSTYFWVIEGGTLITGANTANIRVNWGEEGLGMVKVVEFNRFGCLGDTVYFPVDKTYELKTNLTEGPDTVCEFTNAVRYSVINTNGVTYYWSAIGGTIISNPSLNSILVNWGPAGQGALSVYEESYDSINNKFCTSLPVIIDIYIAPYPTQDQIIGDFDFCQFETQTFRVNGFNGSTYIWEINGNTSGIDGQGTNSINFTFNTPGTFNLRVKETTLAGCEGEWIDTLIFVRPKPTANTIIGDAVVCFPNLDSNLYRVNGFVNSTYSWTINGGTIIENNNDNILVNWSGQQLNNLSVFEVSEFGCIGDTLELEIFIDQPSIEIDYISVGFPDDRIEIFWNLINAPRYNSNFIIEFREAGSSGSWRQAGQVNGTQNSFVHNRLNTDLNPFEYRVRGFDLCGQEIISDVHININIKGQKTDEGYEVVINWSDYSGWANIDRYEIWRAQGFETELKFEMLASGNTETFIDGLSTFKQVYRIKAYRTGDQQETWSNDIVFTFDPLLWVPNAFTPNADRANPFFTVKGGSIKRYSIEIYDRWGGKVFESDDLNKHWDGNLNGMPVPEGVYVYVIRYAGFDDNTKLKKGNITLIR